MQELAEHGKVELRNGIVMHVGHHNETSFSLRPSPDNQPDPAPVEQQEADPKKDDGQVLPPHERRSGPTNFERFSFFHGKTDEASVDEGTSANAGMEADKSSTSAAEGPVARRRASRARKKHSAGQTAESSEGRGRDAVPNRTYPLGRILLGLSILTGMLFSGPITGLLLRFNGREQVGDPLPNFENPITQARVPLPNSESHVTHKRVVTQEQLLADQAVLERLLQDGRHAVLEQFGSYIPASSRCYEVDAKISDDLLSRNLMGAYYEVDNWLRISPWCLFHYKEKKSDCLHTAMHEYCHCFTHDAFYAAVQSTPNREILTESLTEQILRSGEINNSNLASLSMHEKWGREAQKLEDAVGGVTLLRAYFSGDADAISKISRAAVDIYPKKATRAAWYAIETRGAIDKEDEKKLAECFVGASLLVEGKLPLEKDYFSDDYCFAGWHLPVQCFSDIDDSKQKDAILEQARQARTRLGAKFDQAFFNFDQTAADQAMKAVREDLLANWQPVMTGKTLAEQRRDRLNEWLNQQEDRLEELPEEQQEDRLDELPEEQHETGRLI